MIIYTIGFTQKSAEEFFGLLRQHGIKRLVDIRVHPSSQLAGFTRKLDLPYFLDRLVDQCKYIHMLDLAPTPELLNDYRTDQDWSRYVEKFEALMDERGIPASLDRVEFEQNSTCLLCSESKPDRCHRRLVAERLAAYWNDVIIVHL